MRTTLQIVAALGCLIFGANLIFFTRRANLRTFLISLGLFTLCVVIDVDRGKPEECEWVYTVVATVTGTVCASHALSPADRPRDVFLQPRTYWVNFTNVFAAAFALGMCTGVFKWISHDPATLEAIGLGAAARSDQYIVLLATCFLLVLHVQKWPDGKAKGYTWGGLWPWPGHWPWELITESVLYNWIMENEILNAEQEQPHAEDEDDWWMSEPGFRGALNLDITGPDLEANAATQPILHACQSHTRRCQASRIDRLDAQAVTGIKFFMAILNLCCLMTPEAGFYHKKARDPGSVAAAVWAAVSGPHTITTASGFRAASRPLTPWDYQLAIPGSGVSQPNTSVVNASGVAKMGTMYRFKVNSDDFWEDFMSQDHNVFVADGFPWTRSAAKYDFSALPASTLRCIASALKPEVRLPPSRVEKVAAADTDDTSVNHDPIALQAAFRQTLATLDPDAAESLASRLPLQCAVLVVNMRTDLYDASKNSSKASVAAVNVPTIAPVPILIGLLLPCWVLLVAPTTLVDDASRGDERDGGESQLRGRVAVVGNNAAVVLVYPDRPFVRPDTSEVEPSDRAVVIRPLELVDGMLTNAEMETLELDTGSSTNHVLLVRKSRGTKPHLFRDHDSIPLPFAAGQPVHHLLSQASPAYRESLVKVTEAVRLRIRAKQFESAEKTASMVSMLQLEQGILSDEAPLESIRGFNPTASILRAEMRAAATEGVPPGQEGECCSICLDDFDASRKHAQWRGCDHWFHESCLIQWARSHNTCPVCRDELTRTNVQIRTRLIASWITRNALSEDLRAHLNREVADYLAQGRVLIESVSGLIRVPE